MQQMSFNVVDRCGGSRAEIAEVSRLTIAGWAGRDQAAIEHHIAELAELGVKRPSTTPLLVAVFMAAIPVAGIIGAPLSGFLMSALHEAHGLRGWQWMFLIEGMPSILAGFWALAVLRNTPAEAAWLTNDEKRVILGRLAREGGGRAEPRLTVGMSANWQREARKPLAPCASGACADGAGTELTFARSAAGEPTRIAHNPRRAPSLPYVRKTLLYNADDIVRCHFT